MAYPFVQLPTLEEFIGKAVDLGHCRRLQFPGTLRDPQGNVVSPRCLIGPRNVPVVLPKIEPYERLTPTLLSNLCRLLGIDPKLFEVGPESGPPN